MFNVKTQYRNDFYHFRIVNKTKYALLHDVRASILTPFGILTGFFPHFQNIQHGC